MDYGEVGRELAWVGQESGLANVQRVLSRPGTVAVTIRFLDPLDPAGAADRKALALRSRAAIVEALGRAPAPSGGGADRL
jgi:1-acyl-sn-glycerol-3-phosphate acyltransferase